MKIPVVGVPDAPQAQQSFAPTPITTYDKVFEGGERIGNAVEGVASDLPVRIKTALDQATLAKADAQATASYQGFVDSLQDGKNPENNDPSTYLKRWADAKANFTNQMAEDSSVKGLSLKAQIEYRSKMERWGVMTEAEVGHLATEKALANGLADTRTNYELGIQIGTPETLANSKAVVEKAVSTGLMHPQEGAELIRQLPIKAEKNQVAKLTDGDYLQGRGPIVAEKLLSAQDKDGNFINFPHLQGEDRQQALFNAFRAARGLEAQVAQKYSEMKVNGQLPDPAMVKKDVELGALSPAAAKGLLAPQKQYSKDAFSGILADIHNFDLAHDDTHQKEALIRQNIAAAHDYLDAPSISRLNEALKSALNPHSEVNTPVATAFFKQAEADHRAGLFLPNIQETRDVPGTGLHGFLGLGKPASKETVTHPIEFETAEARHNWEATQPREVVETERTRYADYLTKMRQFFIDKTKDGKGPTDQEVNDYARTLRRPYVMQAVSDSLNGTPKSSGPAAISTKEEFDALPSGAAFTWNGRQGVKK
jgi:hypothetical protein